MLNNVKNSQLDNGLTILSVSDSGAESVAVGIWVKAGGRYESNSQAGFSHFLEHMLFKGTSARSSLDITQEIEGRGGYLNAYTQEESACYYVRLPYEFMEEGIDVLSDMYMNASISDEELVREREVILEEIKMYQDMPHHLVQEKLQEAMFKGHAVGRPLAGSEKTLNPVNHAILSAYKEQHYKPCATVVAVSGRVNHDESVKFVNDRMGALPAGSVDDFDPLDNSFGQEPIVVLGREITQVHAVLGFRIFGRHEEKRFALRVMNGLLGENMSSRLFQSVRERHGLCYSIQSGYQLFDDCGMFTITGGFDSKRIDDALKLTVKELNNLVEKGVDADELVRTKEYLLGTFRLGLESVSSRMNFLGESYTNFRHVRSPEEVLAGIQCVTATDIQSLAAEILTESNMTLAMVTPNALSGDESRWLDAVKL
ncbi:MAG: pitrilysin family protein [Kiritimatiellae bacterium]|jgi:predicted Zn-dependent peptidase|nr:pitrilysin family protein [Kiritimatiellia bacterium]